MTDEKRTFLITSSSGDRTVVSLPFKDDPVKWCQGWCKRHNYEKDIGLVYIVILDITNVPETRVTINPLTGKIQ